MRFMNQFITRGLHIVYTYIYVCVLCYVSVTAETMQYTE